MAASGALQLTEGTVPGTPGAGILDLWATTLHIPACVDPTGAASVLTAEQWCIQTATQTATSGSGAQTWFPSNAVSTVAVAASTSYQFEGLLNLANGTTSHTTALLFNLVTATLTSIKYLAMFTPIAENTAGATPQVAVINQATSTVFTAASTVAAANIYIRGLMRVNAGGTIAPQFQWSANPTGTNQVLLNTFFRIWPIGTNTGASQGLWT
jgi:hypothetical protein